MLGQAQRLHGHGGNLREQQGTWPLLLLSFRWVQESAHGQEQEGLSDAAALWRCSSGFGSVFACA
jgi:hypothetical protein